VPYWSIGKQGEIMASKFQSRLVGTIVLVAVGVIVLPDVLDGEKQHYKEDFVAIPIKPQLESEVESFEVLDPIEDSVELPPSPVEVTLQSNDDGTTSPEVDITEAQPKAVPEVVEVTERPVPERNEYQDNAWIIQLIALRNADNAEIMVKDLRKRGYQAHVIKENGFSRVIIGPDVSRTKLESQLAELKKITGSQGQIQTFKPLKP
jgi:DedD protein